MTWESKSPGRIVLSSERFFQCLLLAGEEKLEEIFPFKIDLFISRNRIKITFCEILLSIVIDFKRVHFHFK